MDKEQEQTTQEQSNSGASQQPSPEFVTKEQLAASLRLFAQLQQDAQEKQQRLNGTSSQQTDSKTKADDAEAKTDDASLKVLKSKLEALESERLSQSLNSKLGELVKNHKLEEDAVEYLTLKYGSKLKYSAEAGFYTEDNNGTSLEDLVKEFSASSAGARYRQQERPGVLPKDQKNPVKMTGNGTDAKPKAEDLLMEAFAAFVRK